LSFFRKKGGKKQLLVKHANVTGRQPMLQSASFGVADRIWHGAIDLSFVLA
jgi:hypothetical protein